MGKKRPGLGAILRNVARGPERSSLFYYLYDNHDDIARAAAGRRIRWEPLVADFKDLDLTDGAGKPATAETARKTWLKVRQEILKQRALRATGMLPIAGSRRPKAPAGWVPSGIPQPNAPSLSGDVHRGSHIAASPAVPQQRPALPPTPGFTQGSSQPAPGSGAAMREEMNQRSGRKANGEPRY